MQFAQLEMFLAVAEERSVQKAAKRVYRTQPAVSIALRKLEEEIGTSLFDRTRAGYPLTPAGEVVRSYATRLLFLRDEALEMLKELTKKERSNGAIKVAGVKS